MTPHVYPTTLLYETPPLTLNIIVWIPTSNLRPYSMKPHLILKHYWMPPHPQPTTLLYDTSHPHCKPNVRHTTLTQIHPKVWHPPLPYNLLSGTRPSTLLYDDLTVWCSTSTLQPFYMIPKLYPTTLLYASPALRFYRVMYYTPATPYNITVIHPLTTLQPYCMTADLRPAVLLTPISTRQTYWIMPQLHTTTLLYATQPTAYNITAPTNLTMQYSTCTLQPYWMIPTTNLYNCTA